MKVKKIDIVCEICGSNELEFDATSVWSIAAQKFLYDNCDIVWCANCEDTVPIKEVEINE